MDIKELDKYLCKFCHNILIDPVYCLNTKKSKHYFCQKCMESNYGDDGSESKPPCPVCQSPNFSWKTEENTSFKDDLQNMKDYLFKILKVDQKTVTIKNETDDDGPSKPQFDEELNNFEKLTELKGDGKILSSDEEEDFAEPEEDGMISKPGCTYGKNAEDTAKKDNNNVEKIVNQENKDIKCKNARFFQDYLAPYKGMNDVLLRRIRNGFNSNLGIYICNDCSTDQNGYVELCKKCMQLNKQLYYINDLDLINKEGRHCTYFRGNENNQRSFYCLYKYDEAKNKRNTHFKYIQKNQCGKFNKFCSSCQELNTKIDKYLTREQTNFLLDN